MALPPLLPLLGSLLRLVQVTRALSLQLDLVSLLVQCGCIVELHHESHLTLVDDIVAPRAA